MRVRAAILAGFMAFMIPWSAQAQQGATDSTAVAPPEGSEPQVLTPPPVPVVQTEPDFPRGRISGYMFGDAYYNVSGDPTHTYSGSADLGKVNVDGTPNITRDLN